MCISDILTIVNIAVTILLGIALAILSYKFNKRLKAYETSVVEIQELNTKVHDRLVNVIDAINSDKHPKDDDKKRLLYNSSRLRKYDKSIDDDVNQLIKNWTEMFSQKDQGVIGSEEYSRLKADIIDQVKNIMDKVDEVQKKHSH